MAENAEQRWEKLVARLREAPGLPGELPTQESRIVEAALNNRTVYEIAQRFEMSEEAIWSLMGNVARMAEGRAPQQGLTGGMGSDTEPGVTGGYGETGFGSLESEPSVSYPEERED